MLSRISQTSFLRSRAGRDRQWSRGPGETSAEIAVALERDTRHANYYVKALETLGLAESDDDSWQLTEEGSEIASVDSREVALAEVMIANQLLVSWR